MGDIKVEADKSIAKDKISGVKQQASSIKNKLLDYFSVNTLSKGKLILRKGRNNNYLELEVPYTNEVLAFSKMLDRYFIGGSTEYKIYSIQMNCISKPLVLSGNIEYGSRIMLTFKNSKGKSVSFYNNFSNTINPMGQEVFLTGFDYSVTNRINEYLVFMGDAYDYVEEFGKY